MLKAVIQTCDSCGIEGTSRGMHVPDGWLFFDLRGGKDPGVIGYGWNVCGTACMQGVVLAWADGKKPMPYGMGEESQIVKSHGHSHADPVEADIAAIAAASAERSQSRPAATFACVSCGEREDTEGAAPEGWMAYEIDDDARVLVCSATCAVRHFSSML